MDIFLQLILLDFGACRTYEKAFMDKYIDVINAASEGNHNKVLQLSREMKFLTGYESKDHDHVHSLICNLAVYEIKSVERETRVVATV